MRVITDQTRAAWLAEVKDGDYRPVVRATVERGQLQWWDYYTENSPGANDYGKERARGGHYSSWLFGGHSVQEIPNIKSVQIVRNLDQDIAEATITVLNTIVVPMGETADEYLGSEEYDLPGALSYNRGKPTVETNRWGHTVDTGWEDMLVPDHIVRTYSGYGIDATLPAGWDPHMYASGVWLIDTAQEDDAGNLVLKCRDIGRTLVDHIAMPPDIPWDSYPMEWSKIQVQTGVPTRAPTGGSFKYPRPQLTGSHQVNARSSNSYYVGAGIVDNPTYVSPSGNVLGHNDLDPLRINQYWLSTGQESADSMVWWELDLGDPVALSALRINTYGGPYIVYVSVFDGTDWVGRKKVPYTVGTEGIDINAKIPFVYRHRIDRQGEQDIVLKRAYAGITKVRLTFTRLRRRPGAEVYPWRAGLRTVALYTGSFGSLGFDATATTTKTVGNYSDYTDVVKWICAWAGFWWPTIDSQRTIRYGVHDSHPEYDVAYSYLAGSDAALARGRVWGSFEQTGTAGVADLKSDQFDKQPLMDAIQVVRNIVGFTFAIDECGGVIWRMPNLFEKGNYVTPSHLANHGRHPTYVDAHEVIDERVTLISYSTTLDSSNLRERIGVAGTDGKIGTVIRGYTPYKTGMKRIALWTDEHFDSNRECRIAADMIAAQQMFSFRRSTIVIPHNPAIQIDDQIRVYERVTNETFYHYVVGISTAFDADTGTLQDTLETHWLGERISDAWVIRVDQLDSFTQAYLATIGPVD